MKHALVSLFLLLALGACKIHPNFEASLPPGSPALIPLEAGEKFPDFSREWEDREDIAPALENSLSWIRRDHARAFYPQAGITHARAVESLERFALLLRTSYGPEDFQRALEREFDVFKSAGWDGRGGGVLFTAYCTPILKGSLEPDTAYRFPLYSLPPDLVKGRDGSTIGWETSFGRQASYPTRGAIEASGMLRGLELVWLADPIDAYIAHVNGSAFVELPDGSQLRLGYAGKNGRPYRSLARELAGDGKIQETGLPAIRAWASQASDEELHEYLSRNTSFVFFTPIEGKPHGSLDVEVTAGRSLATDKTLFPRAALVFVEGPAGHPALNRFLLDQDTGGAIRTAGRADIYLGVGPRAEQIAGRTKVEGQLYYLFLKE